MLFGLEQTPNPKVPDYEFKFKQKVHLEKRGGVKAADGADCVKLVTGDFYIHNPKKVHGFIKIAASERDCDIRIDSLWYAKVKDLVDVMTRRKQ